MARVVIVGGGGTGDATAFALRKRGFEGDITILSADADRPYDRPYLSKELLRGEIELPKVFLHEESAYSHDRIELRVNERVTGGSLKERKLFLAGGTEIGFDVLVLGLGGTPRRLPATPVAENVLTLRSLQDDEILRAAIQGAARLLIVGAGFIGAEVAASSRQLGKEVVLIEAAAVPLERALGRDVGEIYAGIHRSHGVEVRLGTTVQRWHVDGDRVSGVTLSDGTREEADLVLVAVGIPGALGLHLDGGGVRTDPALRAADNVYVGGDIALHPHPVLGRAIRVEHWEVAKGHGRGIAVNIAENDVPYTKLPYFWSDQYDVNLEYRGNASGDDKAVWRGDRGALSFSVFYLRNGVVDGVLSMNDTKTNETGGKLIESRRQVSESALENPAVDLAELVASPI
jgi:3-phenylpropionate/trans-cinnamate dioxygenase ferredoxin reductase subunit